MLDFLTNRPQTEVLAVRPPLLYCWTSEPPPVHTVYPFLKIVNYAKDAAIISRRIGGYPQFCRAVHKEPFAQSQQNKGADFSLKGSEGTLSPGSNCQIKHSRQQ